MAFYMVPFIHSGEGIFYDPHLHIGEGIKSFIILKEEVERAECGFMGSKSYSNFKNSLEVLSLCNGCPEEPSKISTCPEKICSLLVSERLIFGEL